MMKTMGYYLNRTNSVTITHWGCDTEFEVYTKQDTGFWKLEFKSSDPETVKCPACGKYLAMNGCENPKEHNHHCDEFRMLTNEELCSRIDAAFEEHEYITFTPQ